MGDEQTLRRTYDELPYETRARRKTHPDTLATISRLFGLTPPPVDNARVLEIGCGTGENLLAIACALPGTTCVGADFSAPQIEAAKSLAAAARLPNAAFLACDFGDLPNDAAPFDYVVAHGVLSWIPPDRHADLLAVCARSLAPGGLLYLSYNTLPGWHQRGVVRDFLLRACAGEESPAARVAIARERLGALAATLGDADTGYAHFVREEHVNVQKLGDSYIAHDLLETYNTAFYFDDVLSRCAAHDLHYVGEAAFEAMVPDTYPPAIAAELKTIAGLRARETRLDLLINRTFRESIFSRTRQPADQPSQRPIATMLASSRLHKKGEAADGSAVYVDPAGRELSLGVGAIQAVFDIMGERFPAAVPVGKLLAKAYGTDVAGEDIVSVLNALFVGYSRGFVHLHTTPPLATNAPGRRPVAPPLACAQVARGTRVTTMLMENIDLDDPDCRAVLPHLDGRNDLRALGEIVSPGEGQERAAMALAKMARVGLTVA